MSSGLVAERRMPWLRSRRSATVIFPLLALMVPAIVALTLGANTAPGSTAARIDRRPVGPPLAASTLTFQQGVDGYSGAVDTFVASATPAADNSAAPTITVDGSPLQHVLIRFDGIVGNGAGQIPPNATILSATLTVNVTNSSANAAAFHRMLQGWSAASTWDSLAGGVQADGIEAVATADLNSSSSATGPFSVAVTTSVAAWVAGGTNLGWALLPGGTDGWGFESSDAATAANRPRLDVTYTTDRPPNAPTGESPASGSTGVSANPTLCVNVSDPDGDPLTVTFKGRPTGQPAPQDFTIIALPDTQFYAQSHPTIFTDQTQWCVDNLLTRNIAFVTQLGDCVNDGNTIPGQWSNANAAFFLLENPSTTGLTHGIPYGIAVGNHDQTPIGTARSGADEGTAFGGAGGSFLGTTQFYNQTFGTFRFQGRGYFGDNYDFGVPGQYSDNMDNHFELFSASGMDFIAFHLEWDDVDNPTRQAVLNWVHTLLSTTYSSRRAIITSHYLLNTNGTFSNQGQATFNAIKDLPNVFLMLAGHLDQANRRTDLADDGHPIHTLMSDYQTRPNGGDGWLRIMTFSPASDSFHVQTYSPTLGQFINSHPDNTAGTAQNDFVLAYDMDSGTPFATIGTVSGVASGGQACVSWPGRETGQEYEWFAEVSDGELTTSGPLWTFTASCSANAECDDAIFCTTDTCNGGSCLHAPIAGCCATNAECADADPCTNDACNLSDHACENTAIDCDDGRACTGPDVCVGGVCQNPYTPSACSCAINADCDDGNPATTDTCVTGTCSNVMTACLTSPDCNDGDACTTDSCTAANLRSLILDGVDDHVTMGAAAGLNASPSFTLETWINGIGGTTMPTGTGTQGFAANTVVPLVAKGRAEQEAPANLNMNYFLGIYNPASTRALAADFEDMASGLNHPVCTTTSLPTTGWHHVAATYSVANGWGLYVDGVAQTLSTACTTCTAGNCTTTPGATPEPNSIQHFAIGTAINSTGVTEGRYAGRMDEVRVWNVERTAAEIADARDELIATAPGLIAHYGFDDSTATDSTTPAENGTLVGSPAFDASDRPPVGGTCVYLPVSCDDGNPCTVDSCTAGGCLHIPANDGGACNDGDSCTTDDICTNGVCAGTTSCDDGNACTGTDQCVSGSCQNPYNPSPGCCTGDADCNDGNPGTTDSCSNGDCHNVNLVCTTTAPDCNDFDACTADACVGDDVSALTFDGTDDYVTMGPAAGTGALGAATFTLETWFKWTGGGVAVSTGTGGIAALIPLVAKGAAQAETPANLNANYILGISGGKLAADFEDTATGLNHPVTGGATITPNTWNHAAATYDGTTWRLYLNGNLDTTLVVGAFTPESTSIQHFGLGTTLTSTGTAAGFYQGRLDEVRVWNVARSLAQIQADRFREVSSAPNLIGRWGLNDNTATTAIDSTTPAENGALTNGPAWSPTDKAPLTSGTCSYTPIPGCVSCSTAADCNDANACTTDSCVNGACVNAPVVCDDGNVCNGLETCNPSTGTCVAGTPLVCVDDGNPCTDDSCNPAAGCIHPNNNAPCADDGNPCTDDYCGGGACTHPNDNANACADTNACTRDACVSGACLSWYAPTPACCNSNADCSDGAASTTDTCSGAPNGTCSNVINGQCTIPSNCDDSNGCTTDLCNSPDVSALNFDGTNDYVTMGAAAGITALGATTFTLETWFRWTGGGVAVSTGAGGIAALIPLVTKGAAQAETPANLNANYILGISGGKLAADFEDTATGLNHPVTGSATITPNVWNHAAATYDGTTWRLYLNGNLDTTLVVGAFTPESTSIQHFGLGTTLTSTGTAAGFYQGRLDEVRVWNVARSLAQIQATQFQEVSSAPNLIGRWGLNDNTGTTAIDSTTPAENGTLTNGPTWSPLEKAALGTCSNTPIPNCAACAADYQCGDSNTCTTDSCNPTNTAAVQFDGTNDYVTMGPAAGTSALGATTFTLETWFKWTGGGTTASTGGGGIAALIPLVTKGAAEVETPLNLNANYILGISGGKLAADFEDNATGLNHPVTGSATITPNTWNHAAATYDGTTWRLYLNGNLDTTLVVGAFTPESTSIQHFGLGTTLTSTGVAAGFYQGQMDEVRVWNVARSLAQIQASQFQEVSSAPNLIGRWSLNDGNTGATPTGAVDSTGRGNHGTLTNGPTWSTASLQALVGNGSCLNTPGNAGAVCRASAGTCDLAETCTGTAAACPADGFAPATTTCRASAGACDVAESCTGAAVTCPADVFAADGTTCSDANECTAGETCLAGACSGGTGFSCDDNNPCTVDTCVPTAPGGCVHTPGNGGVVCRASAGICDTAETCTGAAAACPADVFEPATTTCRPSAGACDAAEMCTGTAATCPADAFEPTTTTCRASTGTCDVAEMCTGTAATCPADILEPPTSICRPSAGTCDVAEMCTGAAAACPADGFEPTTTTCRASAGTCDVAEMCTGTAAACPADVFAPATTTCRLAAGTCDVDEMCTGAAAACPADVLAPATTTCRASTGTCDVAETCTGAAAACPADGFAQDGTSCSDGNECTVGEACQAGACSGGTGPSCDDNNPCTVDACAPTEPGGCVHTPGNSGAVCRASAGICDPAETCTGTAATCPADVYEPTTTTCRVSAGTCDVAEMCTGTAATCPADVYEPTTTTCRVSAGACDVAEMCTGTAATCPADIFAPATTTCRPSAGTCDVAEMCTGTAAACPADAFAGNGTPCSDGNACTVTDSCQAGTCTSGAPLICVASDQCHAPGVCNPASGLCSDPAKPDGSACDDGNPCTAGDSCISGVCTSGATPPEVCNGLDDDCDTQIDEGNPGGGAACSTGQPGVCAAGVTQCSSGSIVCVGTTSPATPNVVAQLNTSMRYIANGSTTAAEDAILVQINSPMRFLANSSDPGGGLDWIGESFDDSGWASGTYGVGYDTAAPPNALSLITTSVPAATFSVFTRATFSVADVSTVKSLFYGADYDDGYVAYLNGVEVARSSTMPAGDPAWNTNAALHESSNAAVPNYGTLIDLTSRLSLLHNGTNVLAVGVWNSAAATSTDLVVVPKLSIGLDWTARSFDDSAWSTGTYGVGYDTGAAPNALNLIKTSVPAGTLSVFTRAHFNIPDAAALAAIRRVTLGVDYDDGTVAWINGVEVLGSPEMPFGPLTPTTPAGDHESSNGAVPSYAPIRDITARALAALVVGDNVLAIGVWNNISTSTDLVLVPRLSLGEAETCDGLDNDCNGIVDDGFLDSDHDGGADCVDTDDDGDGAPDGQDCRPSDPLLSAAPPAEIPSLSFIRAPDRSLVLSWTGQGDGLHYDMAGGLVSQLRSNGGAVNATCIPGGNDLVDASFVDTRPDPPIGDGYYYMVRSQSSFCGSGTYGYSSSGTEHLPATVGDCP